MRHWLRALENRSALDWEQITLDARDVKFFKTSEKGIPYFLTRLKDREIRYRCIVFWLDIVTGILSPLDLYFCLHQLNADELIDMFTRLPKDLMHNVRGLLFIFLALATASVARRPQTILIESLIFLNINSANDLPL
ncbi:hypothetical protein NPIL_227071 [Nephila pilipes]|uniref:Uncharacterized protein n=1 Tax=Nephila pilipes TaxID=299642 RepID=A0A8X6U975_NEPPI|nr:hypothetical protein NPIL_227071 [Nephila pilipes]